MRIDRNIAVIAVTVLLEAALLLAFAARAGAFVPGERIKVSFYSSGQLADTFDDLARGPSRSVYAAGLGGSTEESGKLLVARFGADGKRLWAKVYRGPDGRSMSEEAIAASSADLYLACTVGTWVFPGKQDIALVKYKSDGTRVWTRVFDGASHGRDYAADVAVTAKGNVYVAGTSLRTGKGRDIVVLKYSAEGEMLWKHYYAGPSKVDEAQALALDADDNPYVAGQSEDAVDTPAAIVIKVNKSGTRQWVKRLHGGAGPAVANDVAVASGAFASVYVAGWGEGGMSSGKGMLCARLQLGDGSVIWQSSAEEVDADDYGYALGVDAAANVIVAGVTVVEATGESRALVAKWTPAGVAPLWQHTFQVGLPTDDAGFTTIAVDAAGNSYCGGYTTGSAHAEDYAIAAYEPDGGDLWANVFSSSGIDSDFCRAVLVRKNAIYGGGSVTAGDEVLPGGMNLNAILIKHQR